MYGPEPTRRAPGLRPENIGALSEWFGDPWPILDNYNSISIAGGLLDAFESFSTIKHLTLMKQVRCTEKMFYN